MEPPYLIESRPELPLAAAAVHDGHALRPEVERAIALGSDERLREEDPFTGEWTRLAGTRLLGRRSRFEVDLNRPRDRAVYRVPEDAWGLRVWADGPPSPELVARSVAIHDAFYAEAREALDELRRRFGSFVVLDLHSYNHRREGSDGAPADPELNPEVNVGTRTMHRPRWARVVDRFIADLRAATYMGRRLDVRENVKFGGGYFSEWVHTHFPTTGCSLAVEFKKFFMDEWTGVPDRAQTEEIGRLLGSTIPGLLDELERMRCRAAS